jgi:hypothetical protein
VAAWAALDLRNDFEVQAKKLDDIYPVLGWVGLLMLVLGTLMQIFATLPRRW